MKTTDSIRELMEMLDTPEAYSEQEIREIINRDDESREAYRQMVEAKRASRIAQAENDAARDIDAAWRRFESRKVTKSQSRKADEAETLNIKHSTLNIHKFTVIYKIAAAFVGVLLMSGIAYATISVVSSIVGGDASNSVNAVGNGGAAVGVVVPADTLRTDSVAATPVVYDNVPLERILGDVAAWHKTEVQFRSSKARRLRLYFVWYREQPLPKVIDGLDHFESVDISLSDNKIVVR